MFDRRAGRLLGALVLFASASFCVLSSQTPVGADAVADLYSPAFVGGGAFVTSTGSAQADAVNPAASAKEQRVILDAGYSALLGLGSESGTGHAVSVGAVFPTKYATFAGSGRFLTSPFDSFDVGSAAGFKGSASKELYPGISAGVGVGASFGTEWTAGLDLGLRQDLGDRGFMKDFRWGAAITGIGKGYAPSAFTPSAGIAFDFLRVPSPKAGEADKFRLGFAGDLGLPGARNLTGRFGVNAKLGALAVVAGSTGFNLQESLDGTAASAVPAFGLTMNLKLGGSGKAAPADGTPAEGLPRDGELAVSAGARPLYKGVWAMGTGVVATLGVVDKDAPAIKVDYPAEKWISPNNDGKADALEAPLSISDKRYVASWAFIVEDSAGAAVRTIRNKERRPETQGFKDFLARVKDVKSGVEVPPVLRWDGVADSGSVVPDGEYRFRVEASDDNGNKASTPAYTVHVDNTAPAVSFAKSGNGDALIFSPDGDGSKDAFAVAQTGSAEDLWSAAVYDASGRALRRFEFKDAAPSLLEWDGRDDAGRVVPDGVYRYEIAATDRAQNSGSARIDNIIVNTERPPVSVLIDEAYFSPNGDGVKDFLTFGPGVGVRAGLSAWKLEVKDAGGAVRRSFNGGADVPAAVVFDGKAEDGAPLAEGQYKGSLTAVYRNGYEAKASTPNFTIDVTPPTVAVKRPAAEADRTFSPDADGAKDSLTIRQSGSKEFLWSAVIADSKGRLLRSFAWETATPPEFAWDGKDESGRPVPDGVYSYRIACADRSGNSASALYDGIVVDSSKPAVRLSSEYSAFSPNGDGTKDQLVLLTSAEKAPAAVSWSVQLQDAKGRPVKTQKGDGAPPAKLAFGGSDEAGKALPEGAYQALLTTVYRNGFTALARSTELDLDLTPPSAEAKAESPAFSPNGDGNLDTIAIDQKGSDEAAWTGTISRDGKAIRNLSFSGIPTPKIDWDGTDDAGKLAPDGAYVYTVSSVDSAGNKGSSKPVGFLLSTENTPVLLTADQKAFSPNGDSRRDSIALTPQLKVDTGVASWKLDVLDASGAALRSFEGSGSAPAPVAWNGKDAKGAVVKDGQYSARLEVRYVMGNRPVATSAPFFVATSAPAISLSVADKAFSPNADGVKDELPIARSTPAAAAGGPGEAEWTLKVVPAGGGAALRAWTWKGAAGDMVWRGKDDAGNVVADGRYDLIAEGVDPAGNYRKATVEGVVVDNEAPKLSLAAPYRAFSPNGDGVKDALPVAQGIEGGDEWDGSLLDADGKVLRSWSGKGSPAAFSWDGKDASGARVADGAYRYALRGRDAAGNSAESVLDGITVDTAAPALQLALPYAVFSPNGDGRKDVLEIEAKTPGSDEWEAAVSNKSGAVMATWKWKGEAPVLAWDGTDDAGNPAPDGSYRLALHSADAAGNRTDRAVDGIVVDNRPTRAFLTASASGVSPNGDGVADSVRFGLLVPLKDGIETWRLDLNDETGKLRKSIGPSDASGSRADAVPDAVVWNGLDADGVARDGRITAVLAVVYAKGDQPTASAGPIAVDTKGPALGLEAKPRYFSPDNDGVEDELELGLNAKDASDIASWSLEIREPEPPYAPFWRVEGKGAPAAKLSWDGRSNKGELVQAATDYPAVFSAVDVLGNASTIESTLGVDVLVIREGNLLKIKVPSIIFRENADDFVGLAQAKVDNNIRVLKRIAQILNKFKDYKVTVEGHANPVAKTAAEEKNELQPLSEKRARAIRSKLAEFGVDAGRLSAIGMGGTRPVVPWEDRINWWKNRRVEFILVK